MKAGQGKNKGSQYERTVGEKLSLWLSHGERHDLICRTVGSGAQFTYSSSGNPGDLMAQSLTAHEFFQKYVVECKFWRDLFLIQFFSQKGDLYKALEKVKKEANQTNKRFWLVAKQNHQPDLLFASPKTIFIEDLKNNEFPEFHLLFSRTVVMYQLDDFLNKVTSEKYLE